MLGAIRGPVQRPFPRVTDAAILRTARDDGIKRAIGSESQPPYDGLAVGDSLVLQLPAATAVDTLVDTASEGRNVQHAGIDRRGGIEQDVSGSSLSHSAVGLCPVPSAIFAAADPTFVSENRPAAPHLGTRQIVGVAVDAPHASANLGIKHDPISSIPPIARHTES